MVTRAAFAVFLSLGLLETGAAGAAPAGPPANLLANPSFEDGVRDDPARANGWVPYQCGYTRSRDRSYAPDISGPWSVRVTGTGKEDEKGLGGMNTGVGLGLPEQGTFAAITSIYVESFTQGQIYGGYITAGYADGTSNTHSFVLTPEQIRANLKRWKTYRMVFSTDPKKKLKNLSFWCLVWRKDAAKFVGTVYFDELELRLLPEGEGAAVPFAVIGRAGAPPKLDGRGDDACWKEGLELGPFALASGADLATQQTSARAAYDDRCLYLFVECMESALDPVLQKRSAFKAEQTALDSAVYQDDCIEIFLMPPGGQEYYHFAVNSLGTVYDARCRGEGANDKGWNSGATAKGAVGERSWAIEVAIPWQAMGGKAPAVGEAWRLNFCREEQPNREYSCWSPTGGAFHTPARFGRVSFEAAALNVGGADVGERRKGANQLSLSAAAGAQPAPVTVSAFVAGTGKPVEEGRATLRLAPGAAQKVQVEYVAPGSEGGVRYEISQAGRLLYASPAFPIRFDTPFFARTTVLGANNTLPLSAFSVVQGELLALPLVVGAGVEKEGFREARVLLDVPDFLRLVNPLGGPRHCPTPARVTETRIRREGKLYRRYTLDFGAESVTFAEARAKREFVLNPLLFRADRISSRPEDTATYPLAYDVRVNDRSVTAGEAALTLLPPLPQRTPAGVTVCNWPCGSTFYSPFFHRLSEADQREIAASWVRTGFNTFTHSGIMREYARTHGLKTAEGLPGTLNDISGSLPGIGDYLRAHPEFRAMRLDGKLLDMVVSPAHLLDPACPLRPLVYEYVGKLARQHQVLSWDYEVPVLRQESIDYSPANLAAFRRFAGIPEAAPLTPEIVVRDHRERWVDFRCRQNAQLAGMLRDGIKRANPNCTFFVYSGYQSEHTRETYGVDWAHMRPSIDQAWCGYGRPLDAVRETRRVLPDRPLVGGELVWLGDGTPYNLDTTEANLFRRLTDSAGGVMVYYDWFVDGRFYRAIARVASVAADFERFFREGKRDDSLVSVEAGDAANVAAFTLGDERLLFLFNHTGAPRALRMLLKDLPAEVSALDYWTRKPVALKPALESSVPGYGVQVVYLANADAGQAPAAPRLLAPAGEAVTDRCPMLRWEQEGSARCVYTVEVSQDKAFPAAATRRYTDVPGTSWVVPDLPDDSAAWYWRVRPTDVLTKKTGPLSPVGRFTLGALGVVVEPVLFSPNGDGRYDTVAVAAELRRAAPWAVSVVNAAGRQVRRIAGEGDRVQASWDGKDAAGRTAPDGRYEVRLDVRGRRLAAEKVELNQRFGVPNTQLERWCTWRSRALEESAAEVDYHVAPAGLSYSLKLTGSGPEAKAYWTNYQTGAEIPITAGKEYTYTALVKSDLAPDAVVEVRLHFFTKENRWAAIPGLAAEWEGVKETVQGKQEWTRVSVSCRAPANAAKAVLFFALKGKGRAWLGSAEFGEKQ